MKQGLFTLLIAFFFFPNYNWAQVLPVATDTLKTHTVSVPVAPPPRPADTNIRVFESPSVTRTEQKIEDYNRVTHGVSQGFRVQIDFGQERTIVSKTKSDFSMKYPTVPAYLTYKPPYFKICVGDFRTKLEAIHFLNIIKKDYKGSFVISDKINQPPLN